MYACGLRISEARLLKPEHIDAKRMVVLVVGKGNKERLVPIGDALLRHLRQAWLGHRNPAWVFATRPAGNPLSTTSARRALVDADMQAGLGDVTSHVFRHSFATRMLEAGVPVQTLQILLGHTDPKTTQTYLHLTEPLRRDIRRSVAGFADDLFAQ